MRQLEIKRQQLADIEEEIRLQQAQQEELSGWAGRLADKTTRYQNMAGQLSLPFTIRELELTLEDFLAELARLDLTELEQLKQEYEYWQGRQKELEKQVRQTGVKKALVGEELTRRSGELDLQSTRVGEAEQSWGMPFGEEYAANLTRLLEDKKYKDWYPVLEAMLRHRKRL
ncbi:hypothetical protein [Desulforamulus putei]|uniref:hypothetical protein n=1 Tax=Desulforamulus putei TaxID=74701 RepID=UPI002FDEC735